VAIAGSERLGRGEAAFAYYRITSCDPPRGVYLDILSIHVILSDQSRGLVKARESGLMRPSAFLVNTARGAIVEEAALVAALKDGVIAGAALDVYEQEPLPDDSALLALENVLLTPHIIPGRCCGSFTRRRWIICAPGWQVRRRM